MTDSTALTDVEQVRDAVDAILAEHVSTLAGELALIGPDSEELVTALATMLSGGKRLRAAFCYWSWRAHGGSVDGAGSPAGPTVDRCCGWGPPSSCSRRPPCSTTT